MNQSVPKTRAQRPAERPAKYSVWDVPPNEHPDPAAEMKALRRQQVKLSPAVAERGPADLLASLSTPVRPETLSAMLD